MAYMYNPQQAGLNLVKPITVQGSSPVLQAPNTGSGDQRLPALTPKPVAVAPTTTAPVTRLAAPTGPSAAEIEAARIAEEERLAEQKRIENITRNLQVSQAGVESAGRQSVTDTAAGYDAKAIDFANRFRTGVEDINTGRVNNALNLRRSMANIANGVKVGLRSGGVTLANMNASDSGAAEALARAYADTGNMQFADVNNDALLKGQEFDTVSNRLTREKEEGDRVLAEYVPRETNRIRSDLFNKLSVLSTQAQNEGINGVIDMGIVDRIVNEAIAALAAVDQRKAGIVGGVKGLTAEEINARAAEMDALGMAGSAPFGTPETATLEQVGGAGEVGAPLTQLPLFVRRRQTA